jgi:hypothetical protein
MTRHPLPRQAPICVHCIGDAPRPRGGSYHAKLGELVQRSRAADLNDSVDRFRLRSLLHDLVELLHELDADKGDARNG